MAQAPVPCDICTSEDDVEYYCLACQEILSERCKVHSIRIKTRNDTIVPLSTVNRESSRKTFVVLCAVHSTEEITLYCEKCSELICTDCISGKHRGHNITTVKELRKLKTTELNNILKVLDDKKTHHEKVFDTETKNHQQYLGSIEQCRQEISAQKSKVIEEFTKKVEIDYDRHFSELLQLQLTEDDKYSEVRTKTKANIQAVTSAMQSVKYAIETNDPASMMQTQVNATQIIHGLEDQIPSQVFTPRFQPFDNTQQDDSIGKLYTEYRSREKCQRKSKPDSENKIKRFKKTNHNQTLM